MLRFFRRINFAISDPPGIVDEGAHFVMYAEQQPRAFRFMKDTGQIWYGKLDIKNVAAGYVWTLLQ